MDYNIRDIREAGKIPLSYSKINLFDSCPRQFFYRYLTDIPLRPTKWPGTFVGQIIHEAVEYTINQMNDGGEPKKILKELKGTFKDKFAEEKKKNKEHYRASRELNSNKEKFYKDGDKGMLKVVSFILEYLFTQPNIIIYPEAEFNIPWKWDDEIMLRGFIDILIKMPDGTNLIYDLKITKDSTTYFYVDWKTSYQKMFYEYFVSQKYGKPPGSFCYIVYNREDRTIFLKEKYADDVKPNKKYFSHLHDRLVGLKEFVKNPDLSLANPNETQCNWCIYKDYCEHKYVSPLHKKIKTISKKRKRRAIK